MVYVSFSVVVIGRYWGLCFNELLQLISMPSIALDDIIRMSLFLQRDSNFSAGGRVAVEGTVSSIGQKQKLKQNSNTFSNPRRKYLHKPWNFSFLLFFPQAPLLKKCPMS